MKYAEAAENVKRLVESRACETGCRIRQQRSGNPPSNDEFIYELLLAYGTPKATISRLKKGQLNLSKEPGEVLLKKKVYFKAIGITTEGTEAQRENCHEKAQEGTKGNLRESAQSVEDPERFGADEKQSLYGVIEELKAAKGTKTNDPRFLIVTDFDQILAIDRKTNDSLDIKFEELEFNFDFFLPWAGMEKTKHSNENPADVKAAEKMAKLFDAIKQENPEYVRDNPHWMNIFLSRLLFCLFAEDTGIFPENSVCNAIASHTATDGSDLTEFFTTLFDVLDTPEQERETSFTTEGTEDHREKQNIRPPCSSVFSSAAGGKNPAVRSVYDLPYVNGGLFRDHYPVPQFSAKARRMLIESGKLNWSEINPDIFGSMFQAVIDPEERHNLGQHYTSVTNIMKVIEPLFLNDFKEELERAHNLSQKNVRSKALHALHDRIANLKIFDPACGSGNFLIIAYKELRKLEMELFEAQNAFPVSRITVDQFYGIEIDDFAGGTAVLALWLAEHQMNLEYEKRFGHSLTSLPLKDGANIVCDNATRIDWETVCPRDLTDEIYVLGNPPYLGARNQSPEQKDDLESVFDGRKEYKDSDYVTCWFLKGAEYIQGMNSRFAFVSTNSITQGEQVGYLWPKIFDRGLEIGFAHLSFKWTNNAKGSAGVVCIIAGVRNQSDDKKLLFKEGISRSVKNISPYLSEGSNFCVHRTKLPLSNVPKMVMGTMARDEGHLILSEQEKDQLLADYPKSEPLIRRFSGSQEFIRGHKRWCLWIEDDQLDLAKSIPPVAHKIQSVYNFRINSKAKTTRQYAKIPHKFAQRAHKNSTSIIIPSVSSEHRPYIPMGFLDENTVISNLALAVYGAEPFLFGILSSGMHMVWVRATAGRLGTGLRYSTNVCYNTFPIPDLTEEQKQTITMHVGNVLQEREKHPEKTMAQLYDPDKMPDGLREAHHNLDLAVDRLYRSKPFASDEERLEHLFKLYEEMTGEPQNNEQGILNVEGV